MIYARRDADGGGERWSRVWSARRDDNKAATGRVGPSDEWANPSTKKTARVRVWPCECVPTESRPAAYTATSPRDTRWNPVGLRARCEWITTRRYRLQRTKKKKIIKQKYTIRAVVVNKGVYPTRFDFEKSVNWILIFYTYNMCIRFQLVVSHTSRTTRDVVIVIE